MEFVIKIIFNLELYYLIQFSRMFVMLKCGPK